MSYQRVIPRDLFNESKLLKCLGQLALTIHEGIGPKGLKADHQGDEFRINQRAGDGGLFVEIGLQFMAGEYELTLYTSYNSKDPYPLICETWPDYEFSETYVFDDDGKITDEFRDYVAFMVNKTPT